MNIIFTLLLCCSLVLCYITGIQNALPALIQGATNGITLCVKLLAVYCVWLSLLQIMEKSGMNKGIYKVTAPLTNRLFRGESTETKQLIATGLATNFLGMSGVATPLSIKAIGSMQPDGDKASDNMIMLFIINSSGIQLIPATVIALRASNNSANPSDVFLPSLICTAVTTAVGVTLAFAMRKRKSRRLAYCRVEIDE